MKIVKCPQYSDLWWEARRGIPTASEAGRIITPVGKKCALQEGHDGTHRAAEEDEKVKSKGRCQVGVPQMSAQADKYIAKLIADKYRFDPNMFTSGPMTPAMRNGSQCEPEARRWYEYDRGLSVEQVGFCLDDYGRFGCSPDGLVNGDGLLELKCPQPETHVGYLLGQTLPDDYKPQVHMQLIVTGRKWVDFVSYCAGFDPFMYRVEPDEFTETLRGVMEEFWAKYQKCLKQFETSHNNAPAPAQFEVPDWLQDPPKGEANGVPELSQSL